MRALPNTMMVERMPQSRSSRSGLEYSSAKRIERISSRNRNSVSSTASSELREIDGLIGSFISFRPLFGTAREPYLVPMPLHRSVAKLRKTS